MREVDTWLYPYNAKAFEDAFGQDPEDVSPGKMGDMLAWGLGYVDYTRDTIVTDLLLRREDSPDGLPVTTRLERSSAEALASGILDWAPDGPHLEDIGDRELGSMIAYAIGFIDFEVLAREYPGK